MNIVDVNPLIAEKIIYSIRVCFYNFSEKDDLYFYLKRLKLERVLCNFFKFINTT